MKRKLTSLIILSFIGLPTIAAENSLLGNITVDLDNNQMTNTTEFTGSYGTPIDTHNSASIGVSASVSLKVLSSESNTDSTHDTGKSHKWDLLKTGSSTGVSLDGYWQFSIDDNFAYADPAYDDSDWEQRLAPEAGGQFDLDTIDATVWFRRSFSLPQSADDQPMWASMGVMDDADEVYINGTLIGASGAFPPDAASAFFHHRLYEIPEGVLNFGTNTTNLIAARVRDSSGGGGIVRGPLGVFTRDKVRRKLWNVDITPVSDWKRNDVINAIKAQAAVLKSGDLELYATTLDADFFHAGHNTQRQMARMKRVTGSHPGIDRIDEILEVGVMSDGTLVAEVHRTWSDGLMHVAEEPGIAHAPQTGPDVLIEFLYFNPDTMLEVGNHARFYRDFVNSDVSNARREFNVYLPPSYFTDIERKYPTVFHLHGAGGNNQLSEVVDIDQQVERLINESFIKEMIVVMPSGRSVDDQDTWYTNSSVEQWRTMFLTELLPQVVTNYRTIDDRTARGIGGWSMGGHGAFTTAWEAQDKFGSIASLAGALSLPPLAGSPADLAANSADTPIIQVNYRDPLFLRSYCYLLYAGEDDDFAFDEAARIMMVELAAKTVIVQAEIKPNGQHNGHTELPGLVPSLRLHSLAFDAHDEMLGCQASVPLNSDPISVNDDVDGVVDTQLIVLVLDNDSDVNHDELRLTGVTNPSFGVARLEYGGSVSYIPDTGFVGTDTFEYTVTDGRDGYATASVIVNVLK
jgi:S-formylglutathione hydrolase FrmB